jgi:hypothetical protein
VKKRQILNLLEKTSAESAIKVIYDEVLGRGGYCRVMDKRFIILNSRLPIEQKIAVFIEELSVVEGIVLPPEIKNYYERQGHERT